MQCQPIQCTHLQGEREAIHSGHFMVSDFEAEAQDDEYEVAVPVPEPSKPCPSGLQVLTFNTTLRAVQAGLGIETSLSKLFQCMSLAYRQKLTSPKWNRFKGIRLRWKDKIRLNNVIWRCWHMQFIKRENTLICQFASPLDEGIHNKPEAVVLEGKYWKRKLAAVTAEYKKWRMFYRNKIMGWAGKDYTMIDSDMLEWANQSSEGMSQDMMVDEDYMDLMSDTLFSTISSNQPFAFPDIREIARGASLADFIQPSLVQLQPNLDDFMDTLEPLQEFFSSKLPPVPENCAVSDATYRMTEVASEVPQMTPEREGERGYLENKNLFYRRAVDDQPNEQAPKYPYQEQQEIKTARVYLSEKKQSELYNYAADAAESVGYSAGAQYGADVKPRFNQPTTSQQPQPSVSFQENSSKTRVFPQIAAYPVTSAAPSSSQSVNGYTEGRGRSFSAPDSQSMGMYPADPPRVLTSPSPPGYFLEGANVRGVTSPPGGNSRTYKVAAPPVATSAHFGFQPVSVQPFSRIHQSYDLASCVPESVHPMKGFERSSSLPSVAKEDVFAVPKVQLKNRHRSRSGSSLLTAKPRTHPPPLLSSNSDPNLNVQKSALLAQLLTTTPPVMYQVTNLTSVNSSSTSRSSKPGNIHILPMPPQQAAGKLLITTVPAPQAFVHTVRPCSPASPVSPVVTSSPASPLISDPLSPKRSEVPERNKTPPADHRRACHINAEQKRRFNIRNGFEVLHSLIPHLQLNPSVKLSKAAMLQKGAEYIRQLQGERSQLKVEVEELKYQIECLNASISNCQALLPATGAPVSRQRTNKMQEMFEEWVRIRTNENWRFWVFSMLFEPLLASFNCSVSTASYEDLYRSTLMWVEQHCSLVNLRPVVLNSMRNLSTTTDILTEPQKLPEEAHAAVSKKNPQRRS